MGLDIAALYGQKGGVRTFLLDATNPATPVRIICPTAKSVKVNPQDSYAEVTETDCNANEVIALKYLNKTATEVSVEFGNSYPELQALAMNKRNVLVASDTTVPFGLGWINVPDTATPTLNASNTGVYGFGVAADAVATAVALINGQSVALTQTAFGAFSYAATRSFAIGANGAVKFSLDIAGRVVSLGGAQHTVVNVVDTDNASSVSLITLEHHLINHRKELTIFQCSFAPERTGIDFSTPTASLKGTVASGAWRMRTLPLSNRC
jgi:hypothetical protein